jgi:nucleotide-binding universal stress UspA family protein
MTETREFMRWVVGIDQRAHSHGAIHFAAWLHDHDRTGAATLDALHVVESRLLRLPEAPAAAAMIGRAEQATIAALTARKAVDAFAPVDAIEGEDVVEVLAAAGALATTTGIIVGRRLGDSESGLVRLGKVVRRLLRRLDSPVCVVPPDLERAHLGAGPLICAVTLDERGRAAASFAESLGAAVGREVVLVHVVDGGDPIGLEYLPEGTWSNLHARERVTGEAELQAWRDQAGLRSPTLLCQGQTVDQLIRTARELDGCVLVCGSRQLSMAERVWSSSVGSTLAAAAHLPVIVVPPPDPEADPEADPAASG